MCVIDFSQIVMYLELINLKLIVIKIDIKVVKNNTENKKCVLYFVPN